MRGLLSLILFAALAWSGYWWVGSTAQKAALGGWLDQQRERGWLAETDDISVTGFPNRFDAIVKGLEISDPNSDWAWFAPEFQILALSYQPNHIIAAWPGKQTIASPYETITISSDVMRGSVRFAPNTGLALRETIIEIKAMSLISNLGWSAGVSDGQLAIRRSEPGTTPDFGYNFYFETKELLLPEPFKQQLDPIDFLPDQLENVTLRMTPVYDAIWDRAAIEGRKPTLTALNIGNLSMTWGALDLKLRGTLNVDEHGFAEGKLDLIAHNWQEILKIAVRAGWVTQELSDTLEIGLGFLAQVTGETNTLDVPLVFKNGEARLGPVYLGYAPLLVQRQ